MVNQGSTDQTVIRARQIPQSIRLLRKLGVSAPRIAGILGDTADNIRHIDSRSYREEQKESRPPVFYPDDLSRLRLTPKGRAAQVRRNLQGIRLRSKQDLDQVEASVWAIFRAHQSVGLEDGYEALILMLPGVANACYGQPLKVRLLVEEKLAWFALPLNRIALALRHSKRAMSLTVKAFRESAGEVGYLHRFAESALVASICLQKMHRPKESFAFLESADEAIIAAGQRPGSEHLRQRGTAFLLIGSREDARAVKAFTNAPIRMRRKDEARHPVDLRMSGLRQRAFVQPHVDWDDVQQLVLDVAAAYGTASMQYEVAARFAAAAGLKVATPASTLAAVEMLKTIERSPLAQILAITPELGLHGDELDRWLRFALYETPISRK